jgi:hypothetical protein
MYPYSGRCCLQPALLIWRVLPLPPRLTSTPRQKSVGGRPLPHIGKIARETGSPRPALRLSPGAGEIVQTHHGTVVQAEVQDETLDVAECSHHAFRVFHRLAQQTPDVHLPAVHNQLNRLFYWLHSSNSRSPLNPSHRPDFSFGLS